MRSVDCIQEARLSRFFLKVFQREKEEKGRILDEYYKNIGINRKEVKGRIRRTIFSNRVGIRFGQKGR